MRRRNDDDGATAVEYALLAALIAGVVAGAIVALGQATIELFTELVWP
jgi:Flp pilus assembly pilin Flp